MFGGQICAFKDAENASLMSKSEALLSLAEVEAARPTEDFSIRRISDVLDFKR